MSPDLDPAVSEWQDVLKSVAGHELDQLGAQYPDKRSVYIDFEDVEEANTQRASALLAHPRREYEDLQGALHVAVRANVDGAYVRLSNLPEPRQYDVGEYRRHDLGDLIAVEGKIVGFDNVTPWAEVAGLECKRCGTGTRVPQTFGRLDEPYKCDGCDSANVNWRFVREESEIVDYRSVTLIPADSNLDDPPTLFCGLKEDLVDTVGPDDNVVLNGVYDTSPYQKDVELSTYLNVWGVEEGSGETDKLSAPELRDRILELAEQRQDGETFGAERSGIVDALASDGVRAAEVENQLETLVDAGKLHDLGGGRIMVE